MDCSETVSLRVPPRLFKGGGLPALTDGPSTVKFGLKHRLSSTVLSGKCHFTVNVNIFLSMFCKLWIRCDLWKVYFCFIAIK